MTLDSEFELALGRNSKQWDERVEGLARNLCFMRGEDPDLLIGDEPNWVYFRDPAETFLANTIMKNHFDDNFAWKMPHPRCI